MAELLCALHPWAEQVRFARSGGEICAIGARIARAATGRSLLAICGYHGWHDWYLAANLGSGDALDEHLLPGLEAGRRAAGAARHQPHLPLRRRCRLRPPGRRPRRTAGGGDHGTVPPPSPPARVSAAHPRADAPRGGAAGVRRGFARLEAGARRRPPALRRDARSGDLRQVARQRPSDGGGDRHPRRHGGRAPFLHQQHLLDRGGGLRRGPGGAAQDAAPRPAGALRAHRPPLPGGGAAHLGAPPRSAGARRRHRRVPARALRARTGGPRCRPSTAG